MGMSRRHTFWVAILSGLVGAAIVIGLFGKPTYKIGPLDVQLSVSPAVSGETRVTVPPLGKITARTHVSPLAIQALIEEASIEELRSILINRPDGQALIHSMLADTRKAEIGFGLWMMLLAFAGGAAGAFITCRERRIRSAVTGAICGTVVTAVLFGLTISTYNPDAFKDPKMTNALKATPWIMRLLKEGVVKIGEMDTQVRMVASNIYKMQGTLSAMVSPDDNREQMRILAISDLHNNTVAMAYADDLARLFDVNFILDAGDLTDFGTGFENGIAQQVSQFDRPHIFVTGNHDSIETVAALRRLSNVKMPNEQVETVSGLRIMGQHDPASHDPGVRRLLATSEQISNAVRELRDAMNRLKSPPDILLVHEPDVARHFMGKVPIIVSGHDHVMDTKMVKGTVWIRPGSTGASGIRYLAQPSERKAITAAIIHMVKSPKPRAVSVDLISLDAVNGSFTVTRKRF